ncbi:MAG TPA: PGF-CTERM sorting domain-containing protein [Candidatus Bathyarchaeia archaeon]|nr:PGF-CTERM sorting domain-containing protein [Candidatus Bathyarchaeia archaeon]
MKMNKILATVLFLAMFASSFAAVKITTSTFSSGSSPVFESSTYDPNIYVGTPIGSKGIWIEDITTTITVDGDLADWATYRSGYFEGINVSVGYDSTYVYVACQWFDSTAYSDALNEWSKWGNDDPAHVWFDNYAGADDMLTVGFSDATGKDLWTWTASSIRTDQVHAYEHDGANHPDAGTKPFIQNVNANGSLPIYDNGTNLITNYFTIPNGTAYLGWFADTPSGSQTDVDLAINHAAGVYTAEFVRLLDPSQADDVALDFSDLTDQYFYVGKANRDNARDMNIGVAKLAIVDNNDDESTFSFYNAVHNPITESHLIRGNVYDDFSDYYHGLEIRVSTGGWVDTYGAGYYDYADVNMNTGNWSYLFLYNSDDMPLGVQNVTVVFCPKYEPTVTIKQVNLDFQDIVAPQILGVVDMQERYPNGYSNETGWIEITCGLKDNYNYVDDIMARLYLKKDDGVFTITEMTQFQPVSTTFNGNATLTYDSTTLNNYTYYIQAIDTSFNRIDSAQYWFIYGEVVSTPGFGIVAAILGLVGASFIIYKKYKK